MSKLPVVIFAIIVIAFNYATNANVMRKNQLVISFSKKAGEYIRAVAQKCAGNDSKLSELLQIVREGRYREDDEFKNFIHCSYKNSGYTHEDGTVNIEISAPLYPDPEAMLKVMKECDKKRGTTPVDNTFEFFKCFQVNSPFLIGL